MSSGKMGIVSLCTKDVVVWMWAFLFRCHYCQGCINYCVVDMHLEPCSNGSLCARVETRIRLQPVPQFFSNSASAFPSTSACTYSTNINLSEELSPESQHFAIHRVGNLSSSCQGYEELACPPEPCRWFSLVRDQIRIGFLPWLTPESTMYPCIPNQS